MAQQSQQRSDAAQRVESEPALRRRAGTSAAPLSLSRDVQVPAPGSFNLIAEVKLRSPAAGRLAQQGDPIEGMAERAHAYAANGACAVSVLTEPSRFDGDLHHLALVAEALRPLGVPVMRKDFLVSPYQILEARAAGASGVLLIAAMLDDARLREMLALAHELGLFVLLEAFDASELRRSAEVLQQIPHGTVLVGLNSRDLRTLQVDPDRFATLRNAFPTGYTRVAESGVKDSASAAEVAGLGYHCALVGSALMTAPDPGVMVQKMLQSGRSAAADLARP